MQLRALNFVAIAVIVIAVVAVLVGLFSFDFQTLQSLSQHDITQAGEADVPTVAYAISLTRVPEGLEGHTALDAVEVSGALLQANSAALTTTTKQHECSTIEVILFAQFTGFGPLD
jgi:hypothetical protein